MCDQVHLHSGVLLILVYGTLSITLSIPLGFGLICCVEEEFGVI